MCENVYDMIIVGSGPAGLTAGIYGKRAGLKVVILRWIIIRECRESVDWNWQKS